MARLHLAPPWITFVNELEQMFKYDPEVHVVYDNEEVTVKVYVDDDTKAVTLAKLLPESKDFGNVELKIIVVPANAGVLEENQAILKQNIPADVLFTAAFKDNGALSFIKKIRGVFANDLTYIVFRNRVVQYYNDNLGDIYGQCSTLYQDIAKNIFGETEGVFFCTDVEEPIKKLDTPLGEWP